LSESAIETYLVVGLNGKKVAVDAENDGTATEEQAIEEGLHDLESGSTESHCGGEVRYQMRLARGLAGVQSLLDR